MQTGASSELKTRFLSSGVEYWSALPVSEAVITRQYLLDRLDFVPKTAIIFLVPYYVGECENISVYAASRDYHTAVREIGDYVLRMLGELYGAKGRIFCDHSPIDERDAAAKCGLGIIGDNGLLINEIYGSYVFIGEIITDMKLLTGALEQRYAPTGCEHCGRCLSACPKSNIGACLSELTQKKGELSEKERAAIKSHGYAWGCDICQSVCPHNRSPKATPIEFFHRDRITRLDKDLVLGMNDEKFAERAFSWRGRDVLIRNLDIMKKDG